MLNPLFPIGSIEIGAELVCVQDIETNIGYDSFGNPINGEQYVRTYWGGCPSDMLVMRLTVWGLGAFKGQVLDVKEEVTGKFPIGTPAFQAAFKKILTEIFNLRGQQLGALIPSDLIRKSVFEVVDIGLTTELEFETALKEYHRLGRFLL